MFPLSLFIVPSKVTFAPVAVPVVLSEALIFVFATRIILQLYSCPPAVVVIVPPRFKVPVVIEKDPKLIVSPSSLPKEILSEGGAPVYVVRVAFPFTTVD